MNTHRWIDLPPTALGFAHNNFNRAAHLRDNAAYLEDALFLPQTRMLVFAGDTPVIHTGEVPLDMHFALKDVPYASDIGVPLFLGVENNQHYFAVQLPERRLEALELRNDIKAIDLRTLAVKSLVTPYYLNLLATARALFNWYKSHQFCSQCGQKTHVKSGGWKRICIGCQTEHFPRTDPVVIMMATRGDYCLLGRSPRFPQGMYSCLAGFMEPGESIEQAVRREIIEETGVEIGAVSYHHSQPWPFPTSLMIGCMGKALSEEIAIDTTELEDARWFSKAELRTIINNEHENGLTPPTKMSIANHLMQAFLLP